MSLVLGMQEGHDLYIGPKTGRVKIVKISNPTEFSVEIKDDSGIREHTLNISDEHGWEIYPGVILRCGLRGTDDQARLIIEAPRELQIMRGNIMRRERKKMKQGKKRSNAGEQP